MSRRQQQRRASRRRAHAAMAGGSMAVVATLGTGVAHAANTFTVTNLNDSGSGSLRAAIAAVNADGTDTAAPGDSIVFASGLTGTLSATTGDNSGDTFYVTNPVQIAGPGADKLTIQAAPSHRVFDFFNATGAKISGLTLTGGSRPTTDGGAIYASYTPLELDGVVISGNTAAGEAGIHASHSPLTITGSTISGNSATSFDGSLGSSYGDVSITGSTISGNTAPNTGGVGLYRSALTMTGSTISGNKATSPTGRDGGISSYKGNVTISNSTIAGNSANRFPGIDVADGDLGLTGSTVVGNTPAGSSEPAQISLYAGSGYYNALTVRDSIVAGSGTASDVNLGSATPPGAGISGSASFSLIRDPVAGPGGTPVSLDATDIIGKDPKLGPLQANGGPTETMVPLSSSPVLDQGKSFGLTTDQRGLPRPVALPTITDVPGGGDRSDIGAVEAQLPAVAGISPPSGGAGTHVAITGTGFTGATQVLFGAIPASSFTVAGDGAINAVAPINAGPQNVRVLTPLGESPVLGADLFTFPTFTPMITRTAPKLHGHTLNTGIDVSCPSGGFGCSGRFTATEPARHRRTRLAAGTLSLAAGQSETITFKLSRKALQALESSGKLKITLQITITDGMGQAVGKTFMLTVKHRKG